MSDNELQTQIGISPEPGQKSADQPLENTHSSVPQQYAAINPDDDPIVKIANGLGTIASGIHEMLVQTQKSDCKDKLIKELHDELQTYKNGLRREMLSPLLRNIIVWHGRVTEQHSFYEREQAKEGIVLEKLYQALLGEYKKLANGLEALLYDYDIESVTPKEGEDFNPRLQKVVKTISTDDATKAQKIAVCVNTGFRDTGNDRVIKQPEVTVYKMVMSEHHNSNPQN